MSHPATQMSFDQLYNGLMEAVEKKLVNKNTHPQYPNLELFNYTNECQFSKAWNVFTRIARGLILNVEQKQICGLGFQKFFNLSENIDPIPEHQSFEVTEKVDGSLLIIYYYKDNWHVATRGSFSSDQSIWAEEFLHKHLPLYLNPSYTYLAEAIYPSNRIVIDYKGWSGFYILGGYDLRNGQELLLDEAFSPFFQYCYTNTERHAQPEGYDPYRQVKVYKEDSIELLEKMANDMTHEEEGFVIKYEDSTRFKIKSPAYVAVHKVVFNLSPLAIWELLLTDIEGNTLKEHLKIVPEELRKEIEEYEKKLLEQYSKVLQKNMKIFEDNYTDNMTPQQFASNLASYMDREHLIESIQWILYHGNKIGGYIRNVYEVIMKYIRPNGNKFKEF